MVTWQAVRLVGSSGAAAGRRVEPYLERVVVRMELVLGSPIAADQVMAGDQVAEESQAVHERSSGSIVAGKCDRNGRRIAVVASLAQEYVIHTVGLLPAECFRGIGINRSSTWNARAIPGSPHPGACPTNRKPGTPHQSGSGG